MNRKRFEFVVGIFALLGVVCIGWLSVRLGQIELARKDGYMLFAKFTNTGGLLAGAPVAIAGVEIGRVTSISLEDNLARVEMKIDFGVQVADDAIVSVRTRGLLGEKFLSISPGGSGIYLEPGEELWETQPAMDLEDIIGKFAFGDVN